MAGWTIVDRIAARTTSIGPRGTRCRFSCSDSACMVGVNILSIFTVQTRDVGVRRLQPSVAIYVQWRLIAATTETTIDTLVILPADTAINEQK